VNQNANEGVGSSFDVFSGRKGEVVESEESSSEEEFIDELVDDESGKSSIVLIMYVF
jgi:hypothetical protein